MFLGSIRRKILVTAAIGAMALYVSIVHSAAGILYIKDKAKEQETKEKQEKEQEQK